MTNQIIRRLEQVEALMTPPDNQPKLEIIVAFVKPADGDRPRQVRYCKFGAGGKLEPVNLPDQQESREDESR